MASIGTSVIGLLLFSLLLCPQSMRVSPFSSSYPQLKLPVASVGTRQFRCYSAASVSLDPVRGWALEGVGFLDGAALRHELGQEVTKNEKLGFRPYLRVRIAGSSPAEHWLDLHKIANDVGIEDFAFATVPPPGR